MEIEKLKENLRLVRSRLVRPIIENGIEAGERELKESQYLNDAERIAIKQRIADARLFDLILSGDASIESGLIIGINSVIKILETGIGMESVAFQANVLLGNTAHGTKFHEGIMDSKVLLCFLSFQSLNLD
jgi:hypothetical protein